MFPTDDKLQSCSRPVKALPPQVPSVMAHPLATYVKVLSSDWCTFQSCIHPPNLVVTGHHDHDPCDKEKYSSSRYLGSQFPGEGDLITASIASPSSGT